MSALQESEIGVQESGDSDGLLSWFERNGGSLLNLHLRHLGGEMGLSLVTEQPVRKGDTVMSIPISLCMTVESARHSSLSTVLKANPELMDSPDEVLALHLMCERRKGENSFWKDYIRTLPDDVDTPVKWTVEGADEVRLLEGTMVGLLTRMMCSQVARDWEEVHLPLTEIHSEVLGGITYEDYLWAMSSIWSRAFDYLEDGDEGDGSCTSRRAMVPVINAANHDPSAAGALSEMIEFHAEDGVANQGQEAMAKTEGKGRGRLRVVAGRDYDAQEQFFILYGRYSNAKLLYSYGFVLPGNPYGSLDYWVTLPSSDEGFAWKQALLDGHSLTEAQAYDFSGTLRAGGWVSPALVATARVVQLIPSERSLAENAFEGKIVSARNEGAALGALLSGLRRKLAGRNASLTVETDRIASLEGQIRIHASEFDVDGLDEEDEPGRDSEGQLEGEEQGKQLRRQLAAARILLEEKIVLTDAVAALEASLHALQSAVTGEAGAPSGSTSTDSGLDSFHPLDSR